MPCSANYQRGAASIGGHWLYADGQPVVHLIEAPDATSARPTSPRIDHVGLRVNTAEEWSALLERMQVSGVSYDLTEVPLTGERQLFVAMAPGVVIELVTGASKGIGEAFAEQLAARLH